jgi:hypothetical protein
VFLQLFIYINIYFIFILNKYFLFIIIGSTAALVDANQDSWTVVNGVVTKNGVQDTRTQQVTLLAYVNGSIYQEVKREKANRKKKKKKEKDGYLLFMFRILGMTGIPLAKTRGPSAAVLLARAKLLLFSI